MKRNRLMIGIFSAVLLAGSAVVSAHDDCDETEAINHAGSHLAQSVVAPPASQVTIKLFQYQPGRVQVKAGTTVTWVNDDEIYHTVTLDNKERGIDAPLDGKGTSFSFTFTQPGTYSYYCDRHEHMRGEIEVR